MKAVVFLAIVGLVAVASAQFTTTIPAPADFPGNPDRIPPQDVNSYPNYPQNAGGKTGEANYYAGQFTLPPGWTTAPLTPAIYTTGYTSGLTGLFPGQVIGGTDPVRGTVRGYWNPKGASSSGGNFGGRGGGSGTGFNNEDIKHFRRSFSTSEFISPLSYENPPSAAAALEPTHLLVLALAAFLGLFLF